GTITTTDAGENIFLKFGEVQKVKAVIEDLLSDRISSRDCWVSLCEAVPHINETELNNFIDEIEIDSGFKEFITFCEKNDISCFILSDGFDYYIERILRKEGLDKIKYYANKLEIVADKLIPSFPHHDIGFPSSANCKRNHVINNSSDEEYTVFIGDGNSDKYTVQYCDFIFAKDDLLKYCEKERISYYPFNNFNDVQKIMLKLISKKRLKKRHQAELKRKEAYIRE
ncbi:MAG: 2-hydroxy-3-keto-5-methylthiopentenyl-1-phosphate phosphatase, partial [Ignavibacteriales bacterium]